MALFEGGAHPSEEVRLSRAARPADAVPCGPPGKRQPDESRPDESCPHAHALGRQPDESRPDEIGESAQSARTPSVPASHVRLAAIVRQYYGFLWRSLRRLGVSEGDVDDAAQRVLQVVARRVSDIEPRAEKSFIFQTALRVASDERRARGRAKTVADEDAVAGATDLGPTPEEQLHRKQARAELDVILDQMSLDVRAVFVLFELEEMSTNEIAAVLEIPAGTVSSRLHRAREEFQRLVARARASRASKSERGPT